MYAHSKQFFWQDGSFFQADKKGLSGFFPELTWAQWGLVSKSLKQ